MFFVKCLADHDTYFGGTWTHIAKNNTFILYPCANIVASSFEGHDCVVQYSREDEQYCNNAGKAGQLGVLYGEGRLLSSRFLCRWFQTSLSYPPYSTSEPLRVLRLQ